MSFQLQRSLLSATNQGSRRESGPSSQLIKRRLSLLGKQNEEKTEEAMAREVRWPFASAAAETVEVRRVRT
jgi:hypothetical protein